MENSTSTNGTEENGAGTAEAADGGPAGQARQTARLFALAGIGALATAYDTASEQFDQFVNRGQRARDEWQDKTDEIRRQNAGARGRMGEALRSGMDAFLNGLNLPSKGDVDTINVKLNILTRKMDDFQMERARQAGAGVEEGPPSAPPPADTET